MNLRVEAESMRQRCLKMDLLSGDGVLEVQKLGVQEISSIAGEAGEIFKRLAGYSVQRIANQGMADGGQMDSDLMRAARMQAYLEGCGAAFAFVFALRAITFANDLAGFPPDFAAHTEPRRGCGTRPMGVRIS